MPVFEYRSYLPFPREDVFDWYSRPGALVRLHPPFSGRVVSEPSNGLQDGSESTLGINLPGLLGTSLTAGAGLVSAQTHLPLRTWMQWDARHSDYVPGEGFSDDIVSGPISEWHHEREFADDGEGTRLTEKVHYELPLVSRAPAALAGIADSRFEAEMRRIFEYRERQTAEELAFHQALGTLTSSENSPSVRVVAVSGASGMIGKHVCAILGGAGIEVRPMVRSSGATSRTSTDSSGRRTIPWDPKAQTLDPANLEDVDVVIHLAGHPLAARFTASHKRKVRASRVDGTDLIARTLARLEASDHRGRALVNGSAVGFYGATPHDRAHHQEILTEDLPAGTDFLADVCRQWEKATAPARDAGVRVSMIRTGIVQTPAGGVLQQMLPLFAVGLGGPLGSEQWQSWISIDDIASMIVHAALKPTVEGPLNGTAPHPVRAKEYAKELAAVLRRPAAVPVPGFGPKLLLGRQGAREVAMADQRASAEHVLSSGFGFRHPTLDSALRHVLGR
ncbi:TIGR01777 family oxidoreductase [Nesterenkonia sp. NBAIMH1]|uniref:TIGR01777 family oxidoreductase n=1 Tax=Nesterenkonia sp. NBAIMH1 TaxID=2600320 RepID=UPI0011B694B2|nr:TIGR01777 family oxidoreductase [Nesterenkonia sp. NBAIMH1]